MFLPEWRMQHNIWESINKHFELTNMHLRIDFFFRSVDTFARKRKTRLFSERVRYYWRISLYHWFEWATLVSENVSISLCTVKQVEIERCCYGYIEIVCAYFFFLLDFSSFSFSIETLWKLTRFALVSYTHTKSVKHCKKLRLMHSRPDEACKPDNENCVVSLIPNSTVSSGCFMGFA